MLGLIHIDKIDHNQTTHIAQAQLAGNFFGSFHIGIEGRLFYVATLGRAAGVDVDRNQGFGRINNNRTAAGQFNFALKCGLDLRFNLIAIEQRYRIFIQLDLILITGHHFLHEIECVVVRILSVDQYGIDILSQVIPNRT